LETDMRLYTLPGAQHFADTYGSGAYGSGVYSCDGTTTTADCASGSGSNTLVNTGIAVGAVVGLACLVLVVTILVRFWRRPAQPVAEPVVVETDDPETPDEHHPAS
jgi:ABC-type multidrug transport system permease subunit